jgi:pyruvate/2-oxoglutarate dehydrogenase complex dihydrolipoamide acyltransferase (E2) component
MEAILVVDLGTATTMACIVADGQARPVTDTGSRQGVDYWQTAVAPHDDHPLVGVRADSPATQRGLFRGRFLQALGQPDKALPEAFGAPGGLLATMLSTLRTEAGRIAGREVRRLLLTIPDPLAVTAGRDHDALRQGMLRAARLAGFSDVELLSEALAIAMRVTERGYPADGHVLVCDAGASALRLTLVRPGTGAAGTDPGHAVSGQAIRELGGDAIDEAMVRDIGTRKAGGWRGKRGEVPVAKSTGEAWEFVRAATRTREALSSQPDDVWSPATLDYAKVTYQRAELERMLREPLRQLGQECRNVLASVLPAGRKAGTAQLSAVVLAGGGAKAPFLAQALSKELKCTVKPADDPDFACVSGAVTWARLAGERIIRAVPHAPGTRGLSWDFKDGGALLLRWLVREGDSFTAGEPLAVVRAKEDDRVTYLTAECSGVLLAHCVPAAGRAVESREVLAVAEARPGKPADLSSPYRIDSMRNTEAFGPDGKRTLVWDRVSGACHEWDLDTGARRLVTTLPAGRCDDVTYAPVTGWAAGLVTSRASADGVDQVATAVRLATGAQLSAPVAVAGGVPAAIRLSADGARSCLLAGESIRVWAAGSKPRELIALDGLDLWGDPAGSFAFSRDGRTLLLAQRIPPARKGLRRRQHDPFSARLVVVRVPAEPVRRNRWEEHAVPLREWDEIPAGRPDLRVALAADGHQAMIAMDATLTVIDVRSGHVRWEAGLPGPVRAAEFSPDGAILAVVTQEPPHWYCSLFDSREEGDGASGRQVAQLNLKGMTPSWVRMSPDMRFLAAGDESGSAVWGLLQ